MSKHVPIKKERYPEVAPDLTVVQMIDRIAIVGCQGSGKTYLAKRLGALLKLPVINLDEYVFSLRNERLSRAALDQRLSQLTDQPRWIIDGQHRKTLENRVRRCDLFVFLDTSPALCMWRLLRRRTFAWRNRIDYAQSGYHWKVDGSLLKHAVQYRKKIRPEILDLATKYGNGNTVVLKSKCDIGAFIAKLRQTHRP
jgi:adenylate kinase family enzyme